MIIVSDTSPITALLAIGRTNLLTGLFGDVPIPEAVLKELLRSHPALPGFLQVKCVSNTVEVAKLAQFLDLGEAEAIVLAKELHADRLLIDERKGRRLARTEGVPIIGLLGVVLLAKHRKMISSARELLLSLERDAGMFLAEDLRETALKSVGE